jgi:hypothetical protein
LRWLGTFLTFLRFFFREFSENFFFRCQAASDIQHTEEVHDHMMQVRQVMKTYAEKVERALEVVADNLVSFVEGMTLGFYN